MRIMFRTLVSVFPAFSVAAVLDIDSSVVIYGQIVVK